MSNLKLLSKIKKIISGKSLQYFISTIDNVQQHWIGASDSMFVTCGVGKESFLVKIYFYYKNQNNQAPENTTAMHQNDAEVKILEVFKNEIIDYGYTPCIIESAVHNVVDNVRGIIRSQLKCKSERASMYSSVPDYMIKKYCNYAYHIDENIAYNKIAYLILERCDITMRQFLVTGYGNTVDAAIFASMLFQLIHTMYVLRTVFKKFRHRDLHTENVMIKIDTNFSFDPNKPYVLVLKAFGKKFYVPYFGFYIKIIDFDHSILPERGIISETVYDKKHAITRSDNDIMWFFHSLESDVHKDDVPEATGELVRNMISILDPHDIHYGHDVQYINENLHLIPSYKDMLKSSLFSGYLDKGKASIYKEYTACD